MTVACKYILCSLCECLPEKFRHINIINVVKRIGVLKVIGYISKSYYCMKQYKSER